MTAEPKIEHKFEYQWGGEENWYTKSKKWAKKQRFPINHLALGFIEWLWEKWVDGKVQMEMADVDKQAEEIKKEWAQQEDDRWVTKSTPSEVEGLDTIEIKSPWNQT